MARHADMAEYRFFATALTLQSKAGGALSGTLENLADMIRRRVAVKERAHALASEARMSIYVLTGLPVVVGGGMALLNPAYIGAADHRPPRQQVADGSRHAAADAASASCSSSSRKACPDAKSCPSGTGFFILPLIVGGGMVFNGMRSDRRLAAPIRRSAPAGAQRRADPSNASGKSPLDREFESYPGSARRCFGLGLLSARTKADVEATLRGAGHSGTCGPAPVRRCQDPAAAGPAGRRLAADRADGCFAFHPDDRHRRRGDRRHVGAGHRRPEAAQRHMKRIQDELPDALDMMVICAQAGLGLGTTIVRVAQELRPTHRAVAMELAQTANELQMMTDGKLPLINFGERCGVDSAKRLASTIGAIGAIRHAADRGACAAWQRSCAPKLITRFEARAARMPVLLTLPMVAFILPSLFLVIGGPAVIQVIHASQLLNFRLLCRCCWRWPAVRRPAPTDSIEGGHHRRCRTGRRNPRRRAAPCRRRAGPRSGQYRAH